jgi:hypothetical protein
MYAADGDWLFVRVEKYERDGVMGHDVDVVRITDFAESGSLPDSEIGKDGAYMAESMSWWPIENVKREDIISAAESAGYDDGQLWRVELSPDDEAYIAERRKLLGWDANLAARMHITAERIDRDDHALRVWTQADNERRAEMLFSNFGGDTVGYGNGMYTTLADAMHAAGVPREALWNTADYDHDRRMRDGWGRECGHKHCIADHIWPRERHMKLVAQWMAYHWVNNENEIADSLMEHLDKLAVKYAEDEGSTPDWYIGAGVFGEEYLTLLPDWPMPPFTN